MGNLSPAAGGGGRKKIEGILKEGKNMTGDGGTTSAEEDEGIEGTMTMETGEEGKRHL